MGSISKCLSRDEIYQFLDELWKPTRLCKLRFRNRKVIKFVDWLHSYRISLNRIVRINVDKDCPSMYVIQIYYLTRRGNERYCGFAINR